MMTGLLASCSTVPGDFCDLYQRVQFDDPQAVQVLIERQRGQAEAVAVNERTAGACS